MCLVRADIQADHTEGGDGFLEHLLQVLFAMAEKDHIVGEANLGHTEAVHRPTTASAEPNRPQTPQHHLCDEDEQQGRLRGTLRNASVQWQTGRTDVPKRHGHLALQQDGAQDGDALKRRALQLQSADDGRVLDAVERFPQVQLNRENGLAPLLAELRGPVDY
eukprot:11082720-Alexandrium_andersonii.AAC.1